MTNLIKESELEIVLGNKVPIKRWTNGIQVEHHAEAQLNNAANLPFIFKHIAVMPDVHAGIGCTVGSVVPTKGAIVPAMVGVDIGCGMQAVKLSLTKDQIPEDKFQIRKLIESAVPHGLSKGKDTGSWETLPVEVEIAWEGLEPKYKEIIRNHPKISHKGPPSQLGTLGTGNHFWELCFDENNSIWVMLHSGSRGVGNKIGTYFIELAKKEIKKFFIDLPDMSLAYFPQQTELFNHYLEAVQWAQYYAKINRELMMKASLQALSTILPEFDSNLEFVDCNHNYVTWEKHFHENILVTRKGAISARSGQLGIIPGSMGTKSYIVKGLGNQESFNSASHGAGRLMSRTEAKQRFSRKDHELATFGVECRKDADIIDETPGAYKPIDIVMAAQKALVEPIHELKQLICVKG